MNISTSTILLHPSYLDCNNSSSEFPGNGEEPSLVYAFKSMYLPIHGYFSISVCVFGIIANIANVIVLTR